MKRSPWKHFCPNKLCYFAFSLSHNFLSNLLATLSLINIQTWEFFFWWKLWTENCRGWIKMSQIYVPPESRKIPSFKFTFSLFLWESSVDGIGEAFLKYLCTDLTAFFQWKWPQKTRTAGNEKELTSQKRNENSNMIIKNVSKKPNCCNSKRLFLILME